MVQILLAISLAPTAGGRLTGSTGLLGFASGIEWLLTAFAIVSLALSVILLFFVYGEHRRSERHLNQELNASAARNAELVKQNYELELANRELRQAIVEIPGKQEEVPENVAGASSTA